MHHVQVAISVLAFAVSSTYALAAVPEQVRIAINREIRGQGAYVPDEGVYKIVFPRDEAAVVLDYQTLSPNLGLNSWAAFTSAVHQEAIFTGQLLLLEDEVNPVLTVALRGRLEVTGLSQLSPFDGPRLQVLDLTGVGTFSELAADFRKCLDEIRQVRRTSTLHGAKQAFPTPPLESAVDPVPLDAVLLLKGSVVNGVYRAAIGRRALLHCETIGREMGVSTWFSFAGLNDRAVVHGEFVSGADDLKKLLAALRSKNMSVISIRHHMVDEHPPLVFVHFRTEGNAVQVARELRYVLDVQGGQVR